jgi:hypothetical protein
METRNFCPRCAIKHLAQARVLLLETRKGYPHFAWYAIGHIAEAEDEIVVRMPEEALKLRELRLQLEQDPLAEMDLTDAMYMVAKGGMLDGVE